MTLRNYGSSPAPYSAASGIPLSGSIRHQVAEVQLIKGYQSTVPRLGMAKIFADSATSEIIDARLMADLQIMLITSGKSCWLNG